MPQTLGEKIRNWKPIRAFLDLTKKIVLPGFDGLPLYEVGRFFIAGIQKGALVTRASAISFKLFLALFPTIVLLLSLIPYIPIENFQLDTLALLKQHVPEDMHLTLEDLITRKHNTVLSIGFILTLYYASNSINAILASFNSSYYQEIRRHPIRQRFVALLLMVVLTLLVIAGLMLILFSDRGFTYLIEHEVIEGRVLFFLLYVAKWTCVVLLFITSISILYNTGDTDRNTWRVVTAGSTLATISCIVLSIGFAWYINNFNQYNKLYGSIGTLIGFLMWIYFNAIILLVGYELNKSIHTARKKLGS